MDYFAAGRQNDYKYELYEIQMERIGARVDVRLQISLDRNGEIARRLLAVLIQLYTYIVYSRGSISRRWARFAALATWNSMQSRCNWTFGPARGWRGKSKPKFQECDRGGSSLEGISNAGPDPGNSLFLPVFAYSCVSKCRLTHRKSADWFSTGNSARVRGLIYLAKLNASPSLSFFYLFPLPSP